jgi:maltose O-acetyltransferase
MSFRQNIVNNFMRTLPPTRFYPLKTKLMAWAGYTVHPTARIVSSVQIWGQMPLFIGEDTFIGHEVLITGSEARIHIGNFVDIAPRVCIISGTHYIDMQGQHVAGQGNSLPIVIEDGAWIGAGTTVIGGVTVGKKAVIGAGSVVVNDIPPFCVAVGNPCRSIKYWNAFTEEWVQPLNRLNNQKNI